MRYLPKEIFGKRDVWQGRYLFDEGDICQARYLASEIFAKGDIWQEIFGEGSIDLSSWFLEGGEAESAEDEEGGEEGEEDEAGEEAVGGEQEGVDKAGF